MALARFWFLHGNHGCQRRASLKVYVLVTNVHPLTVYLYTDGLARFCTDLYEAPEEENLEMREMHLTNFSINWESDAFEASLGEGYW